MSQFFFLLFSLIHVVVSCCFSTGCYSETKRQFLGMVGFLMLRYNQISPRHLKGPFPRKMIKINSGSSQILSKVFVSKNMKLELTKYC